jgi:hypothetical protein
VRQDGRDWAILSMESVCAPRDVLLVLDFLDGDVTYGNQCKLDAEKTLDVCPDQISCVNDTLDQLCADSFLTFRHRIYLGLPVGTCSVNANSARQMSDLQTCQFAGPINSPAWHKCDAARQQIIIALRCMPCDEPTAHTVIVPDWNRAYFSPQLVSSIRWNLIQVSR